MGLPEGRAGDDAQWFLFWAGGSVLCFFALAGIFTLTLANWPAVGYAAALPLAMDATASSRSRAVHFLPLALAAAVTLVFYAQCAFRILPFPPGADYTREIQDWTEFAKKVREVRAAMPHPERTFVYSRHFQVAARLAFYAGDGLDVTRLGGRHDQYDYWRTLEGLRGRDAVFVGYEPFRSCVEVDEWSEVQGGEKVRTFYLYRCLGLEP